MSPFPPLLSRPRRRSLGAAALLAGALALASGGALSGFDASSRAAAPVADVTPRTDDSLPALEVTMLGATPQEAGAAGANETWGLGVVQKNAVLVRYTTGTGWVLGPGLEDRAGEQLSGFTLDQSPLAGQMTPTGAGVLVGTVESDKGSPEQVLLTRKPGQAFRESAAVPAEALEAGELFSTGGRAPLLAALEEAGSTAGALVVPFHRAGAEEKSVLHWDGETNQWTREAIEIPASSGEFRVLAIGASSPSNAWLLARVESPLGGVELFHRHLGSASELPVWQPVVPPGGVEGEALTVSLAGGGPGKPLFTVPGAESPGAESVDAQVLTVTADGVWIDGVRADTHSTTTMYYTPEPSPSITSWCPPTENECDHTLPEEIPTGPSRSIAWANVSPADPFGERVITGLEEGVSLRLEGTEFRRVLALGGSAGSSYGAAFTNPREGWLGAESLPVHLSLEPVGNRLRPWPVPFRRPLLAVAPQPDAPVGALSSEALAVGDLGEVARYVQGEGWEPESLLGPGGRVERPRLRAVAWPTPMRAYAVGDGGEMWLWRGETGLWEADPATPPNFRGNLLGIAFDPSNPAIGYAIGSGTVRGEGVLLRYGKTWTQEPAQALPSQVQGATFTSIAFAGSEAIVAYRRLPIRATEAGYEGGLIVNNGSGWHVEEGAAAAMGSRIPGAVAGLADGGAAFDAYATGSSEAPELFEREAAGAPWRATPTPLAGGVGEPSSIALFREGEALRAVVAGNQPESFRDENQAEAPPGSPPTLIEPYKPPQGGGVLRQTATGWSDEEHELKEITAPSGNFKFYDAPYQPDPVSAILLSPNGTEGWAIGGYVNADEKLETSDVERYPAEASPPPGEEKSTIETNPSEATFAVAGGAGCKAPCADRAEAAIGPDVWLSAARRTAEGISGLRAFLYTGPRLASLKEVSGAPSPFPYPTELERYAQLLGPGGGVPAYTTASPTDLDEAGGEGSFEAAFDAQWPVTPEQRTCAPSSPGCHLAYAFSSQGSGPTVRVIVLDESSTVGPEQLAWLEGELAAARAAHEPAIAVGYADVKAAIEAHGPSTGSAIELAEVLVLGHRSAVERPCEPSAPCGVSAYFYYAPEQNVEKQLTIDGQSRTIFGSGTLGYIEVADEDSSDFLGTSGFLLAHVAQPPAASDVAPVTVSVIPNVGELALEAKEGPLLRRSEVAQFAGLARRPRSGTRERNGGKTSEIETDPYIPIPNDCFGAACGEKIPEEFTFSSEHEGEYGEFVKPNLASAEPNAIELGANGKPIHDPKSGLFCAYNATPPGHPAKVTVSAGGLSASLELTIEPGSVRRPCGTNPIKPPAATTQQTSVPTPLAPAPTVTPTGAASPTPLPLPLPPATPPPAATPAARATPAAPFFLPPAPVSPLLAAVPPPVPTPARPTPPSGTSAVTTPVEAPEKQEEQEEAPESVSNKALAYRAPEHEPAPEYLIGIVVLAALAGASARPRRRGRRELRVAPATISSMRAQRRADGASRRRSR